MEAKFVPYIGFFIFIHSVVTAALESLFLGTSTEGLRSKIMPVATVAPFSRIKENAKALISLSLGGPRRSHSAFFMSVPRLIVPTTTVPLPGKVKALSIAGTPKGEGLSCKANSADPYITGLLTPSKPKSPSISRISISTNSKTS
ncbi:hypothetical protein GQX74_011876 [Glossina fuscipes]|nr:hypothetical protein GQX74_011876 [Glossina fuscipes]